MTSPSVKASLNFESLFDAAQDLYLQGDEEQARELLGTEIQSLGVSPEQLLERGKRFIYDGQLALAGIVFHELSRIDEKDIAAKYYLGSAQAQQGEIGSAIECWKNVLEWEPDHAVAKFILTGLEQKLADLGKAKDNASVVSNAPYIIAATEATAELIVHCWQNYGLVVIRGAVSTDIVGQWQERFEYHMNSAYFPLLEEMPAEDNVSLPLHFAAQEKFSSELQKLCAENISITPMGNWDWAGFNKAVDVSDIRQQVLGVEGFDLALKHYLAGNYRHWSEASYLRRFVAGNQGVPFHQDAGTGYWQYPVITTWLPLTPCGAKAPGLDVVPCGFGSTLFPKRRYTAEERDYHKYRFTVYEELIPEQNIVSLDLQPGDMLAFTNFTLHRTQLMSNRSVRMSMDLRFTPC